MGIIRKQTVSGSFFSYAGVLLGFVNLAVLSPLIFSSEQIGVPVLIISISILVSQLGSLGFNGVTIRLFPYFREKETRHNGFLGLNLLVQSAGLIITILAMLMFIPGLIERNQEDLGMLGRYAYLIIPVIVFQLYFVLLDSLCRVIYNATLGIFLKEFLVRVLNLLIILLFSFGLISFSGFMYLYVAAYGIPTLVLLIYLVRKNEFNLKLNLRFISNDLRKDIVSVSIFGVIAGFSGIAVMNIDRYMVNEILNLSSLGVYTVAFSFGTLILIPGRAMAKIAAPVLADLWKSGSISEIKEVYRKSSINQFLGGLALLLVLWVSVDDVFLLLPAEYAGGKYVILFIALANLITAVSGLSNQVISTSKTYRYNTWFMLMLIVLVVITNLFFIPLLGISGAALATFVSTLIYTVVRIIFLQVRFRMQPFSFSHILSLVTGSVVYLVISQVQPDYDPIINILIRSALAGVIFVIAVYLLKCSPDFNEAVKDIISLARKKGRN